MGHYAFNWFAVPPLLTAAFSLAVGLLVLSRDRGSPVARALFLLTAVISLWMGATAGAYCSIDAGTALAWIKAAYIGVPMIPAALCLHVSVALRLYQRMKVLVWSVWVAAVVLVGLSHDALSLLAGVEKQWWGYYPRYGIAGYWLVAYFAAMILLGFLLLRGKLRAAPRGSKARGRIEVWLIALLMLSLAAVDFVPKFGVPLYPFGYVGIVGFLGAILVLEKRFGMVYMTPAFAAEQVLATMQGAVLVTDLKGIVEMCNQAASELLGYSEAELVDASLEQIFAGDEWRTVVGACARGGQVRDRETTWRPRSGTPIEVSFSASPAGGTGSRPSGVVLVALDITARKLGERTLAAEKEHLARLNEAAVQISHCLTVEEVQRVGLQVACKAAGFKGGVMLPLPRDGRSRVTGSKSLSRRDRVYVKNVLENGGWAERVARERASLRLEPADLAQGSDEAPRLSGALATPVAWGDEVLAVLCLVTDASRASLSEADIALAEGVAALTGVALENARRYDDAKFLSQRDSVTGLLNHRGISALLDKELARSERAGGYFAVVMMDLDNFKLFNDTYGHACGDQVLQRVAGILDKSLRRGDFVGRYGGDEFLALLPDTDAANALATIGRVKETLDKASWSQDGESAVPLCLSYGVATYPNEGRHLSELLAAADANLYRSKGLGGNRVTATDDVGAWAGTPAGGLFTVLDGLVTAVDGKDHYTRKHSDHVSEHSVALACELGLSTDAQRCLHIAGMLHDVGKIGIPDRILRKPGSLNEDEFEIVKQHVDLGELIIKEIPNLVDVIAVVGCHHERWDGSGYPRGLRGKDIPQLGRILAVADAYSAMTTDRPYRKALDPIEAREELRRVAGAQLDPGMVAAFLKLLDRSESTDDSSVQSPASVA
jgi:diguanylate cyclase (GGDEF)-like protein/PAS domain S-box-containing protein